MPASPATPEEPFAGSASASTDVSFCSTGRLARMDRRIALLKIHLLCMEFLSGHFSGVHGGSIDSPSSYQAFAPESLVANQLCSRLSHLVLRKGASPLKVAGQSANSREKRRFPMVIPRQGLAMMAAAAVEPVFLFVLLQRGAEGDEMLVLAPVDGSQEHAALTNTADGQAFTWASVRLAPGNWVCCHPDLVNRLVAPPPMKNLNVNWLCSPPLAVD